MSITTAPDEQGKAADSRATTTAIVTGGARGLGLAIAHALRSTGANVVIAGRDREALVSAAALLGAARYTGGLWVGKYLKTVTYQEVLDENASARLGELCGRASRVELFEGHARSGDVREARVSGRSLPWHNAVTAA